MRPTRSLIAILVLLPLAAAASEPLQGKAPPAAGEPSETPRRDILGTESKLYSHHKEELIIRDFFQDRKGGTFLDVGSADPIKNSTTYYLERHLGWSGVAVDALSEFASAYKRKRPRTQFFAYIVTDHAGTQDTFYRVEGAPELSSTENEREIFGKKILGTPSLLPTITLNAVLERAGVEKIDFLSMDIEGGTEKALAGFDIDKYKPEFVCVERNGSERFLRKYFRKHGYKHHPADDFVNWYFKRKKRRPKPRPQ